MNEPDSFAEKAALFQIGDNLWIGILDILPGQPTCVLFEIAVFVNCL